ncbi:MAG: MBL fold metallo-hydrolase [Deltaproteobacteria bacterium]|nr:MBL fold metallo-hydrolase [Deltaproteobacteria bacterium]
MSKLSVTIVPVTGFQQNCSIVQCIETKECVIIDPGGDLDVLQEALAEIGGELKAIWLTHAHIDHAGAVAVLEKATKVPVIGPHIGDQFWIDLLPEQSKMFGFPDVEVFTPTRWLEGGDQVDFGKLTFDVVHCPGHTPGHVVFFQPEEKLAFVGDVLFQGSIGRTDFPQGSLPELTKSIREGLFPLGDDVTFVCGHGPTSTFGEERKHNPFVGDDAMR